MKSIALTLALLASSLAAQAQQGLQLSWNLSTSNGITKQLVCRSLTAGTEDCTAPIKVLADNATTTFLDTPPQVGVTYFYVLEACIQNVCSEPLWSL